MLPYRNPSFFCCKWLIMRGQGGTFPSVSVAYVRAPRRTRARARTFQRGLLISLQEKFAGIGSNRSIFVDVQPSNIQAMRQNKELTVGEALEILEPRKWTSADPATGTRGNYGGEDMPGWVLSIQTRDSDALARSNFQVIGEDMRDVVEIHRTGHWACGWVEWIILPHAASDEAKVKGAEWIRALEDYPVANDEHLSALEYSEALEYWQGAPLCERLDIARRWCLSPFVIRRDELPETPTGELPV